MNLKLEIVKDIRNSTVRDNEQADIDGLSKAVQNKSQVRPTDALPILNNREKLIVRLRNFFEPYPHFSIREQARPDPDWPVKINVGKPSSKGKKFTVEVLTSILGDVKSQWKDGAILSLAKNYVKTYLEPKFDEKKFFLQSKEFNKLQELESSLREKENQSKLELAQSISKKDLCSLWIEIRKEFFPDRKDLDDYQVVWSGRKQTSSLASCNVARKRILVAPAMRTAESLPYLEPLLYHEMCHAYLGEPPIVNGRRVMHGKDFKELEKRHPAIPKLDKWIKSGGWHEVANS